ncbi:MAG: hypothetical protein ACPGWR_03915 [Ardenticatenaceae bacterium]
MRAAELGVDGYFANTLPEDTYPAAQGKANLMSSRFNREAETSARRQVRLLRWRWHQRLYRPQEGARLRFVSMRGASTIATSTAQVVMMNANLSQLCNDTLACRLFDLAHDFDKHMQTSFLLSLAPGVLTIGGALLLGLGITSSVLFNVGAFALGSGYILSTGSKRGA